MAGAAATTWTVAAGTVAATIELAAIDPAELSARIAGMMMVRLMDMIPPSRFAEVSGLLHDFYGTRGTSELPGVIVAFRLLHNLA